MSVDDIQGVFDAVRKACALRLWSRGVELSRADAVLGERSGPDEIVVRVSTKGGMIARSVTLFPEDEAWECSCGAAGGCEHAAAAVIALKRAREEGRDLPTPRSVVGRVVYRFTRTSAGLALERGIGRLDYPTVIGQKLSKTVPIYPRTHSLPE